MSLENSAEKKGGEPGLPASRQLCEIFSQVLAQWAYLPSEYAGTQVGEPSDLPLEKGVFLRGGFKGTLVVRAAAAVGPLLAEAALGDAADENSAVDSFQELINVFCGHFLTRFWPSTAFDSFLPVPLSRFFWPEGDPAVSGVVSVEGYPIEIRFWIEPKEPV